MILFRASRFLRYAVVSGHRRGHGIHSPFIFDLVSRIFRNKISEDVVLKIEGIRRNNLSENRIIQVNDLGAGTERKCSSLRKVSDIARYSSIPEKYGILLSAMAAEFGKPAIVELGTSLGISTLYLSLPVPGIPVYSVEGCSQTASIASENFLKAGAGNIKLLNGPFHDMLPEILDKGIVPGLVFIDGDHRKERLTGYFSTIAGISNGQMVVIIDDIHYSKDMEEAWDVIRNDSRVTATVDIFRMGIVFMKKGISRMNYVVKY